MQKALWAILIGFLFSLVIAKPVISYFHKLKNGQPISQYVESHLVKSGTPTMGGIIFLFGCVAVYFIFLGNNIRLATLCVATMLGFGLLGFLDDFLKVKFKHNEGLKPYQKALGQLGIAMIMAFFIYFSGLVGDGLVLPWSESEIFLSWGIVPFVLFFYIAVTNSVNLMDGLDGLTGGVGVVYLLGFMVALFLQMQRLENWGEGTQVLQEYGHILTLMGGMAGGLLAFLCFNSHPAKIFMGDTGALALGGFLASVAVLTKMELFMPLFGIMFVITAVSDVIQVLVYKATKKRVFLMAPLHHHFEKKGWHETKIVAIYIIITLLMTLFTVATFL